MKKVILLVRVSTSKQDYEDQTKELIAYAEKDGYTLDDMEIIQDKESATKLSDDERQGFTKMYAAINDPTNRIQCVYCWELSRISRKPVTLYEVQRELLNVKERVKIKKDRGMINLKIKNPSISLLNEQGQIEAADDYVFGMFVNLCKSEITTRVDRMRRTKISNARKGKYNGGGRIMFGYTVDKDGYFSKETERGEADAVLQIFQLYSTGQYGEYKLYKELEARGVAGKTNLKGGNLAKILKTEEYTGELIPARTTIEKETEQEKILFHARQYPAIITRELFEKCKEVRRTNTNNIDKSQNIYLGAKLCKCSDCGLTMVANKNNAVYRCDNKYHVTRERKCKCGDTVSINVVDSIVWRIARSMEIEQILNFNLQQLTEWENKKEILQMKIDNSDQQYETIKAKKIKRFLIDVPDANLEEQEKHGIRATRQDKQRIEQEKVTFQIEIDRINRLIAEVQKRYNINSKSAREWLKASLLQRHIIEEEIDNADDQQRYDIVHKHIKEIKILQEPNIKGTKRIVVKFFDEQKDNEIFFYNGRVKDKSKRLYKIIKIDFSKITQAERNFLEDDSDFKGVIEEKDYFDYSIRFERKK